MTHEEIRSYEAKGWRFHRAVQPDPRSGENSLLDTVDSPRLRFYVDLDRPEKDILERENHMYAYQLYCGSNAWETEKTIRALLLTRPEAKKAVITVTLE
jgi:hypothetical protein